jgi:hypothetical protein
MGIFDEYQVPRLETCSAQSPVLVLYWSSRERGMEKGGANGQKAHVVT